MFGFTHNTLALALFCCSLNLAAQQKTAVTQLTTLAPMPIAVQEIYPVLHQGDIYVAGGISDALPEPDGQMTAAVQIYDIAKNQWRRGPDLPEGRHHAQLVSVGSDLYLIGGFVRSATATKQSFWQAGNWQASADILKLSANATSWQAVGKLPKPLAETVSFVKAGQIHLPGGQRQ